MIAAIHLFIPVSPNPVTIKLFFPYVHNIQKPDFGKKYFARKTRFARHPIDFCNIRWFT
jgi:hypothetical protein